MHHSAEDGMKKHKSDPKKSEATSFAGALRETLALQGVAKAELARRVGASPSAVSNWTIGRDVPGPRTVFAVEAALGLSGGYLSRLLGYGPCGDRFDPPGPAEAIMADPRLRPEHKKTLLGVYKS
ncbi:MAG TPA: helix-turn-helix transcriptional regulator, partial [Acidimicrobiia bacterium]|nr:helix-turn-helix transcriptional regulator [Acidimicrobiia bacterium]